MLRILLVGSGTAFAIKDLEHGYLTALRADEEVDLKYYSLEKRLPLMHDWLRKLWRARGKLAEERPTWSDIVYRGGVEALEMALRFDVDWVLAISGMLFHPDVLQLMRRAGIRTSVLFTESPYQDEPQARMAPLADLCWTTERTSTGLLGAGYLRHAYDPERHRLAVGIDESVPAHDVVFVGSGHEERIAQLEGVDWTGIDLGLYGKWTLLGSRSRLRKYVRGGIVSNDRAVELYRRARIGLNLHRISKGWGRGGPHVERAESANPRTYELAACGVFQISDYRAELVETFGSSIPTFDPGQLEETIRAYLNDSPARCYAARRARAIVEPHTFAARAAQLVADLEAFDDRAYARGA